jgi:diguanylate cyclase (GGDEF)-like protein
MPPVTMSMGVAVYPDHGTAATELIRAADEALYTAKSAGRNRVEVAGGNDKAVFEEG